MLSEKTKVKKIHTVQFHSQNDKIIELKNKFVVAEVRNRGGRGGKWVWIQKGNRRNLCCWN